MHPRERPILLIDANASLALGVLFWGFPLGIGVIEIVHLRASSHQ
jgi:hypothetical protein